MVAIVWDHLMAYGVPALLKTALIIMNLSEEKILAASEFRTKGYYGSPHHLDHRRRVLAPEHEPRGIRLKIREDLH